jgi:hypothetical protein
MQLKEPSSSLPTDWTSGRSVTKCVNFMALPSRFSSIWRSLKRSPFAQDGTEASSSKKDLHGLAAML